MGPGELETSGPRPPHKLTQARTSRAAGMTSMALNGTVIHCSRRFARSLTLDAFEKRDLSQVTRELLLQQRSNLVQNMGQDLLNVRAP